MCEAIDLTCVLVMEILCVQFFALLAEQCLYFLIIHLKMLLDIHALTPPVLPIAWHCQVVVTPRMDAYVLE